MGTLFIVATPIGNLKDIGLRALETLKEVDLILCEDTRKTKNLLDVYGIKTSLLSYHQHSKIKKINEIIGYLEEGKNLALVSDAGTPGISDPGNFLISQLVGFFPQQNVSVIPGPSALAAAASVSGFPMDKFLFLGFPPVKKRRKKFFEEIARSDYPAIFYESPYRIIKTLTELNSVLIELNEEREVVVCRELTKKFETIYRGKINEVVEKIKKETRGEFVVIVNKRE